MAQRTILDIPVDQIRTQLLPRTASEEGLIKLVASIKKLGIIEPLVVLKTDTEYILQAGMRRLTAAKQIGLPVVPCVVVDCDKQTSISITLHENLYREDLNPIDEAYIYQQLRDKHGYSAREIAAMVSQSEGYVSQRLQIVIWDDIMKDALKSASLSFSALREFAIVTDVKHRNWLIRHGIEQGVNYRTARRWRIDWQSRPTQDDEAVDYTKPPPPEEPVTQPQILCWWCGRFFNPDQVVTIQLCHSDFSALQFSKEKVHPPDT